MEQIQSMEDMRQTIVATVEEAMVTGRISSDHQIHFITHIEKAFEAKERHKGGTRDAAQGLPSRPTNLFEVSTGDRHHSV